jgi:cell division protein ZapA
VKTSCELRRLADVVDTKLRELTLPGRQIAPQSLLLAAIALAHDLEEERERRKQTEQRCKEKLHSVIQRIDTALEATAVIEQRSSAEQTAHHES